MLQRTTYQLNQIDRIVQTSLIVCTAHTHTHHRLTPYSLWDCLTSDIVEVRIIQTSWDLLFEGAPLISTEACVGRARRGSSRLGRCGKEAANNYDAFELLSSTATQMVISIN